MRKSTGVRCRCNMADASFQRCPDCHRFFTSEKILSALGASGELLTLGNEYIKVIALGAILQVFGTGLVPFMRNYGGSLWAMIAMICGFATNIALDYTFVWVLGRGMYGAALATIIGQGVTMAVALVYCAIKRTSL